MEEILGDRVIVDLGSRAGSVIVDEPTAVYAAPVVRELELTPTSEGSLTTRRALVELRRFHGGTAPHALLGAEYRPGGDTLVLQVLEGASERRRRCRVQLGGRKLVAGMPPDLVEATMSGLARRLEVGTGRVTVDRAAFDPVETSPLSVELAAELLGRVLSLNEGAPTDVQLRSWLEALP